jgi:hypothetical protein
MVAFLAGAVGLTCVCTGMRAGELAVDEGTTTGLAGAMAGVVTTGVVRTGAGETGALAEGVLETELLVAGTRAAGAVEAGAVAAGAVVAGVVVLEGRADELLSAANSRASCSCEGVDCCAIAIMPMPCGNELKSVTLTQAAAFQCLNLTLHISKQVSTDFRCKRMFDRAKYGFAVHLVPRTR